MLLPAVALISRWITHLTVKAFSEEKFNVKRYLAMNFNVGPLGVFEVHRYHTLINAQ